MSPQPSDQARSAALKIVPSPATNAAADLMIAALKLPDGYLIPESYKIDERGVRHGEHRAPVTSAPLFLTKVYIDPEGCQLVELAWLDRGRWVRRVVPRSAIASGRTMVAALADVGLPVTAMGAGGAEKYLAALEAANRSVLTPEPIARWLGWQEDGTFVCGATAERRVEPAYPEQAGALAAHRQHGTLSGWRDAVKLLADYPTAQMVLCIGFAPALLRPLGLDSHTVDIAGRSTRGKTTSAKVAFSPWGDPSEHADGLFSWRTTPIAVEKRLNLVRGLPVIIDETRVASRPGLIDEVIYQVPKNRGQGRGGGWPSLLPWETVVISTGEQPALSFTTHQGAAARVLSLARPPFPKGDTAGADARAVTAGVAEHHGHAGPAFVESLRRLLNDGGHAELRRRHSDLTEQLHGTNDMTARRAPALAAHVLAGQLAYEFGVLPFEPPSHEQWLDAFQVEEQTDDRGEMALNLVREYVASNGDALWRPHVDRDQPYGGWIGRHHDVEGAPTVALLPEKLRQALERAHYTLEAVLPAWQETGVLLKAGRGRTPWLPILKCGAAKVRLYVFAPGGIEIGDRVDAE